MGIFSRQAVIKMPEPSREARYALATAEVEDSKQQIEVLDERIAQFKRTFNLVEGPWRTIQHVELRNVSDYAKVAADWRALWQERDQAKKLLDARLAVWAGLKGELECHK